jgi:hypothetical protein
MGNGEWKMEGRRAKGADGSRGSRGGDGCGDDDRELWELQIDREEMVALSTNPQFMALIERSRARHRAEGGISSEEMRRRLGLEEKANHWHDTGL